MIEIIPNWHPVFVHFTITLITFSGLMQCFIWLKRPDTNHPVRFTHKFINITGLIAIIVTILSGYHAYSTVGHDAVSHLAMTAHRNWAMLTLLIFAAGAIMSLICRKKLMVPISGIFLVLACLLVTVTAYKGGELVYRYGLGVLSLPDTQSSEHHHDNGHTPDNPHHTGNLDASNHHDDGHHH
ncbi:hypothetical protein VA7868_00282 [Vibrio aerogenes CECT 7868]|uniref:DUF2231 domain-containing protein n=1 Tax=Vibrio aerogenes CECT 7868 TaxID=1216006 RepID=A0A1M5V6D7_9VIBR|nr:DUF2231 domain-containing protein [Vibrio aerogenes]SHH70776.1 hypothetical protein VA7868_00282 [Vibrio aerogenes CECT 7868]